MKAPPPKTDKTNKPIIQKTPLTRNKKLTDPNTFLFHSDKNPTSNGTHKQDTILKTRKTVNKAAQDINTLPRKLI
jgi:hypothetical protein